MLGEQTWTSTGSMGNLIKLVQHPFLYRKWSLWSYDECSDIPFMCMALTECQTNKQFRNSTNLCAQLSDLVRTTACVTRKWMQGTWPDADHNDDLYFQQDVVHALKSFKLTLCQCRSWSELWGCGKNHWRSQRSICRSYYMWREHVCSKYWVSSLFDIFYMWRTFRG